MSLTIHSEIIHYSSSHQKVKAVGSSEMGKFPPGFMVTNSRPQ